MWNQKVILCLTLNVLHCFSFRITDYNDRHWQAFESNMREDSDFGSENQPDKKKRFDYESQKLSKEQIGN